MPAVRNGSGPVLRFLRISALGLLLSTASAASILDSALDAYLNGQPEQTIRLLTGRTDAPSLALLARAYGVEASLAPLPAERQKLARTSEKQARTALAADASNADAHIELGNALAFQLTGANVFQAVGVGTEIRRQYERAVQLDPAAARGWVGLGIWHAQALALGPVLAFASGASEGQMRANHRRAVELQPNEVFFRLSYADSLLLLADHDARRALALRQEARSVLLEALKVRPLTYWQRLDQDQVRERLKLLNALP